MAGAMLGAVFAAITAALGFGTKLLLQFHLARRLLRKYGEGIWYSAEYDTKGNVPKEHRATYLKVRVSATFQGGVKVTSIEQLNSEDRADETGWIVKGRIEHGVLIGEWRTSIKNTLRFGSAMLRFLDSGRAVGYWIGVRGYSPPQYGYRIMSKDLDDLKAIVASAVPGRYLQDDSGDTMHQ